MKPRLDKMVARCLDDLPSVDAVNFWGWFSQFWGGEPGNRKVNELECLPLLQTRSLPLTFIEYCLKNLNSVCEMEAMNSIVFLNRDRLHILKYDKYLYRIGYFIRNDRHPCYLL